MCSVEDGGGGGDLTLLTWQFGKKIRFNIETCSRQVKKASGRHGHWWQLLRPDVCRKPEVPMERWFPGHSCHVHWWQLLRSDCFRDMAVRFIDYSCYGRVFAAIRKSPGSWALVHVFLVFIRSQASVVVPLRDISNINNVASKSKEKIRSQMI